MTLKNILKFAIPAIIIGLLGWGITYALPCVVNSGCTGRSSIPVNSLLYGSSTNQSLNVLSPGTNGYVLQSIGGVPTFVATSTLGFSGGSSSSTQITVGPNILTSTSFTFTSSTPASGLSTTLYSSGNTITWGTTLQAGYTIPLSASTTQWSNFFNTPSTQITAGSNLSWSGNTLNGTMASSTLTAGGVATFSPNITITTTTPDTNVGIQFTASGNTLNANTTWTGTLADGRIASAANWNGVYNNVLSRLAVATGTAGNIFNIATTTNSLTLNLPIASASNTGQLSSTDWTTFNGKQAAGAYLLTVATTSPITGAGTAASPIACPTCTVNGVTSVGATYPITTSGGTTPTIAETLGNLTLTSGNLSFGTGDGKLILAGTSTNITLTANPTFTNLLTTNASTTNLTVATNTYLPNVENTFLATNPQGLIIATTTPGGLASYNVVSANGLISVSTTTNLATLTASTSPYFTNINASGTLNVTGQTTVGNASTTNLTVTTNTYFPNVAGQNCLGTSASGLLQNGTCPGGSGSGVASVTPFTAGYIPEATGTTVSLSNSNIFQSAAGNIGIGSTTPNALLSIQQEPNITPILFNVASSSTSTLMTVLANGNVGIGNFIPTDLLDVESSSTVTARLTFWNRGVGNSAANAIENFRTEGTGGNQFMTFTTDGLQDNFSLGSLNTTNSSDNQFQITKGAALGSSVIWDTDYTSLETGINSSTPAATFGIKGLTSTTINPFMVASSSNAVLLVVSPTGNVGIGSTTPNQLLSVGSNFWANTNGASTTNLTVATNLYNTSLSNGCLNVTGGLIGSTGTACGAGGGLSSYNVVSANGLIAVSTTTNLATLTASTSPYFTNVAVSGTLGVTGQATLVNASTTNLTVATNSYLGTVQSGVLTGATGLPLTTGVTGVLPIANGGTSTTSAPTQTGQILESQGAGWGVGNFVNTTNATWTTSTPGSLSVAISGFIATGGAVTGITCSGSVLPCTGTTPTVQLQNMTTGDILFGAGTNTFATSSNFTFTGGNLLNVVGTINATSSNFTNASTTNLTVATAAYLQNTVSSVLGTNAQGLIIATSSPSFANLTLTGTLTVSNDISGGGALITNGSGVTSVSTSTRMQTLGFTVDGGSSSFTTGIKGSIQVPYSATLKSWTLLSTDPAFTTGTTTIDIWKTTYANFPSGTSSIVGTYFPQLKNENKESTTTLTGWTTTFNPGDVLIFNVTSTVASLKRVTLVLTVQTN